MIKHVLAVALATAVLSASPAFAQVSIIVGAPPPPRVEVIPAPRHGYVWAPGYWNWEHNHHVWAAGHFVPARYGHHWVPDRWSRHNDGWHHDNGHWDHD